MSDRQSITIDVVSDVVCPWCYLGQKRLDRAIFATPEVDVTVNWRPYQLDPTIPAGGMDRQQYMLSKFGDPSRIAQAHERLVALGAAEGIDFAFEAIKLAPNTLNAHRVIRWAGTMGDEVQGRVVRRLFALNFEEGADLGDAEVLAEAAGECGLDAAVVRTLLASEADVDAVKDEIAVAGRMGITGVPCFLLEGRYAVMGAQDTEVLADAIRQVAQAMASGELDQPN